MNYYNDFDKTVCAWTQELIDDGLIPAGKVDCRSITEVTPNDLDGFTQCHFFCGISGWALALRLAGWPDNRPCWSGSCPCQPFSVAGKGGGVDDPRHLWPPFRWLVARRRPGTVFGEQVASADGRSWLAGVRADMAAMGYGFGAADLCSAGVGSPNIRQRLWWVADAATPRREGGQDAGTDYNDAGQGARRVQPERNGTPRGVDNALRSRRDGAEGEVQTGRDTVVGASAPLGMADAESSDGTRIVQEPGAESEVGREGVPDRGRGGARGVADVCGAGLSQRRGQRRVQREAVGPPAGEATIGGGIERVDWARSRWHLCRDGKQRRVPEIESVLQCLDSRLLDGVDLCGAESAFPLAGKIEGRTGLLKGYGNSINPVVAAEFIAAYADGLG